MFKVVPVRLTANFSIITMKSEENGMISLSSGSFSKLKTSSKANKY